MLPGFHGGGEKQTAGGGAGAQCVNKEAISSLSRRKVFPCRCLTFAVVQSVALETS